MMFLLLLASAIVQGNMAVHSTNMLLGEEVTTAIHANQAYSFCYEPSTLNQLGPHLLFQDTIITVSLSKSSLPHEFPWYSVRGVSTDDMHSHLEGGVYSLLASSDIIAPSNTPYEKASFLRDVVSSCPNPLFNKDRGVCPMRFSSFGMSCVTLSVPSDATISVNVQQHWNVQYVIRLVAGLLLLSLAHPFSKSKVFQYSILSLLFVMAGAVLLLFFVFHRLFKSKKSGYSLLELGVGLAALGSYLATILYYLRIHFQEIILQYWEIVLGYLATSSLLGLGFVRVVRSNETAKHFMVVVVKWCVRIIAVVLVYNSFASPLASLVALASLTICYIAYALKKWVVKGITGKKEKK